MLGEEGGGVEVGHRVDIEQALAGYPCAQAVLSVMVTKHVMSPLYRVRMPGLVPRARPRA